MYLFSPTDILIGATDCLGTENQVYDYSIYLLRKSFRVVRIVTNFQDQVYFIDCFRSSIHWNMFSLYTWLVVFLANEGSFL